MSEFTCPLTLIVKIWIILGSKMSNTKRKEGSLPCNFDFDLKKMRIEEPTKLGADPSSRFLKLSSIAASDQVSQSSAKNRPQQTSQNSAASAGHPSKPSVASNSLPPSSVTHSTLTICGGSNDDDDDDIEILSQTTNLFFASESTSLVLVWINFWPWVSVKINPNDLTRHSWRGFTFASTTYSGMSKSQHVWFSDLFDLAHLQTLYS